MPQPGPLHCTPSHSRVSHVSLPVLLQEDDIISWDSDELNRIHNLHVREFKDIAVRRQRCALCRQATLSLVPVCLPAPAACGTPTN